MKNFSFFGILILPIVLIGCGSQKTGKGLLLEPTLQNILNQHSQTSYGTNVTGKMGFKNKIKWPFVSSDINDFLDKNKRQSSPKKRLSVLKFLDILEIKKGVKLQGLNVKMLSVLSKALPIWKRYGKNLVITSALEGKHCKNSLHYDGLALDLRNRDLAIKSRQDILKELSFVLGDDFMVLLEPDHFHVEFDPKTTIPASNQLLLSQHEN
jgi:hypothetical protein